jgi:hypothetical protein
MRPAEQHMKGLGMRKIVLVVIGLGVACVVMVAAFGLWRAQDGGVANDPQSISDAWLRSLRRGDCAQAAQYWLPKGREDFLQSCGSGQFSDLSSKDARKKEWRNFAPPFEYSGMGESVSFPVFLLCERCSIFDAWADATCRCSASMSITFEKEGGQWYVAGVSGFP